MDVKTLEWNKDEPMSKEYALGTVNYMKCFCRRLFYFPNRKAFIGKSNFDGLMKTLDGLEEYIKHNSKD